MLFNAYLVQRLAEERIKAVLREAEQERLLWAVKGKTQKWRPLLALMLGSLLGLITLKQS